MGVYTSVYLKEQVYFKAKKLYKKLGYRSVSQMVNDVLEKYLALEEMLLTIEAKEFEKKSKTDLFKILAYKLRQNRRSSESSSS